MTEKKPRILSGIQPSGIITLGNYIGAIRNWATLQDDFECFYMLADLHTITVRQVPADLRKRSLELMALLLACGVDTEKSLIFFQSHVPEHTQLNWVLNCYTQMGELSRMTQFKDKSAKNANNINAGLFTYPVLMASDILLYQADLVPVGKDQTQHLEICCDIAQRFNRALSDTFTIPKPYISEVGAKIMSLQNPSAKMSKSDSNENAYISLLDDTDTIIRKCKRAVTDSEAEIVFREGKDGINNLLTIYSVVSGKTIAEAEKEFAGKGYGDFKLAVGEAVAAHLKPIREKFNEYMQNKDYLQQVYTKGAEAASYVAQKTLRKVYKKVGFIPKG